MSCSIHISRRGCLPLSLKTNKHHLSLCEGSQAKTSPEASGQSHWK